MPWTPRRAHSDVHHTLVDGVPQYMHSPLRDWFVDEYMQLGNSYRRVPNIQRMQRHDLAFRDIPYVESLREMGPGTLFDAMDDESKLDIIDWTIYDNIQSRRNDGNRSLAVILDAGSSMWKVGIRDGVAGLERRVPEGVQIAAEAVMATSGHAGTLLSEAWHAAFGVGPNPETAHRKAVLAVEAAAIPVVISTDKNATLGKVFTAMRDQANWRLGIAKQHADYPIDKVLLGMVQMLWAGQGRHAGQPDWTPNTQTEAEAAVMLAVPLVQWFSSGAIARRP